MQIVLGLKSFVALPHVLWYKHNYNYLIKSCRLWQMINSHWPQFPRGQLACRGNYQPALGWSQWFHLSFLINCWDTTSWASVQLTFLSCQHKWEKSINKWNEIQKLHVLLLFKWLHLGHLENFLRNISPSNQSTKTNFLSNCDR